MELKTISKKRLLKVIQEAVSEILLRPICDIRNDGVLQELYHFDGLSFLLLEELLMEKLRITINLSDIYDVKTPNGIYGFYLGDKYVEKITINNLTRRIFRDYSLNSSLNSNSRINYFNIFSSKN